MLRLPARGSRRLRQDPCRDLRLDLYRQGLRLRDPHLISNRIQVVARRRRILLPRARARISRCRPASRTRDTQ